MLKFLCLQIVAVPYTVHKLTEPFRLYLNYEESYFRIYIRGVNKFFKIYLD